MVQPNQWAGTSDPTPSNILESHSQSASFREAVPSTSFGNASGMSPPLPPRPDINMAVQPTPYGYGNMGYGFNSLNGNYGMGGYGYNGYSNFGNYGMGIGGGMGGYGGFNRFPMYGDIESRFIQMAEENSRPAFDSIQSIVNAVGSVAMMLENTFIALTSSFRAILGVAENFGRLRSLFAQFWSTFAVIRSLNWIIRKLLVILGIRTENEFKAWAQAVMETENASGNVQPQRRSSGWPIMLFLAVIGAAPYIVLKMFSSLTSSINERLNDPTTWQNPLRAVAQHPFQATSPQEVSFQENQIIYLAPQHLQGTLWNSGWLMASTDRQTAGLVPVNYIKVIKPASQEESNQNLITENVSKNEHTNKSKVNEIKEHVQPTSELVNDEL
ncbi:Peroxisomal membrane protein PEX13 [Eumeta japonica]|uniref:Peroxisomal membrane protein PEX13 n=1 Tax=Eumeta variegata TaxID=151549 RepID=A0A4C1SMI0_EUMVA|nr:Peroxisomal membrane protein PEX13 [Eumeta japonica]